ncbi:hypothetical protein [Rhodococcoides fascians]|uniref:hypothetical protein n=1 Tax=Rhodococcoides fascians TaxID=1828 RepID=UPI00056AE205|nr:MULTISPECIES: hypothetical protein [Rhodococcus]OZF01343.1 hypothetical protein CH301_11460 [Rhodococcus sp. 15-1189-1-1a]OZF15513.1 hypothetical protein CH299_12010 [Rhodococcus sp. 14-2686-1-2]
MQGHLEAAVGPQGYVLHGQDALEWEAWEAPWHGASAKLSRAEEHYWSLHSEVWQYLSEVPPEIRFENSPDLGADWYTMWVKFSQPSIRIAIIFGDMVANLRSALDHSLTATHRRAGRRAQFPIFDDEAEFDDKFADRWLADQGPQELIDILRPLQPFGRTIDVEVHEHWLRMLATINNSDKHLTLVLTANAIADDRLSGHTINSPVPVAASQWYPLPQGPDQRIGAEQFKFLAVRIPHLPDGAELKFQAPVFASVAVEDFQNILEVAWVLLSSTATMTGKLKTRLG